MSEFAKSKRSMLYAFGSFFLAITILAASVAYLFTGCSVKDTGENVISGEEDGPSEILEVEEEEPDDDIFEEYEDEESAVPVHYNRPGEMRGAFLTPGTDIITSKDTSDAAIKSEIDAAIASAVSLTMNSIIIDTVYGSQVIYQTQDSPEISSGFDIMDYIVKASREAGLYTYAIFDMSFYGQKSSASAVLAVGAGAINTLSSNLREFAEKYPVDGIFLDGYINTKTPQSYNLYTLVGAAMGFDNFMRQSPETAIRTASSVLRRYAKGTQIGLLADAVWANSSENEEGSATKAAFTALVDGNADTKAFVSEGLVDFVAVKAYAPTSDSAMPFGEVVKWWSVTAKEAGIPMYAIHDSGKICTNEAGWQSQDQLVRQVIVAQEINGFGGSIFNNLKRLSDNPQSSTTTLVKYYKQEVVAEHILTELAVTKPDKTSFTTNEPVVTFTGASDPNSPVTINGEAIKTDASGYFTVTIDLKGGENSFVISHKSKNVTYNITREIEILKDITPMGSISAEGSMSIQITALAYEDAAVYAEIGGTRVEMIMSESQAQDEASRDSSYKQFVGQFKAPAATSEVQNIGNITVYASWKDQEKSIQGASIKINKRAKIEDGVPVVVIADQAMTYPPDTLNNIPNALYYPLPEGAMDYAVGDEIVYKKGSDTYTYFVLASKMRVESADIAKCEDYAGSNAVSAVNVYTDGGYTYAVIKTAQSVSYSFTYSADGVGIKLHNTTGVPDSVKVDKNAIFGDAYWDDTTLNLNFVKSGGFMGYKGYYENGDLIFRFNNPPSSISGARIAIDPGHGGKDYGALGFLPEYPEKVLNLAIAQKLADELTARGAKVLLLDTSSGMDLKSRVRKAEDFGADLFVSVHNNTAPNAQASGTECYYFYPFSKTIAASAAANVSSQLGITNRGAKQSYYHVTLSSQMPSVLVECGFMSNKNEYETLIKSKSQSKIASGIADSIASAIKAASTGYKESSTSSVEEEDVDGEPREVDSGDVPDTNPPKTSENIPVKQIFISDSTLEIEVGKTNTLSVGIEPTNASDKTVTWKSGNTSVATVSSSGKVSAISEGSAKITVTSKDGGFSATCQVTVIPYSGEDDDDDSTSATGADNNKVEDMELDEEYLSLKSGESHSLKVKAYPSSAKDLKIMWSSSDKKVATVNSSGKITAVSQGACTVIGELVGTDIELICEVEVSGSTSSSTGSSSGYVKLADIDDVYFDTYSATLYVGKKTTLILTSDDGDVDSTLFKWESSDTSIARVDSSGVVSARGKAGKATISAYTSDDKFYAQCTITVTDKKVSVTSVTLNKSSISILKNGVYKDLKATLAPSDATIKGIKWSSENARIAKVDSNGVITGVNRGETTITATSEDGNIKATCTVTVIAESAIEEIWIDAPETLEMYVGDEDTFYVYFYPDDVQGAACTWKSNNPGIVSVDADGNITALKEGTAIITVRLTSNPAITATCKITVFE